MSKEMLELLLCPFCGSPGAICCIEDEPDSPCSFWVSCSCGIETRERRTEAEAIALWNTRASAVAEPVARACPKCQNTGWCHAMKACELSGYPLVAPASASPVPNLQGKLVGSPAAPVTASVREALEHAREYIAQDHSDFEEGSGYKKITGDILDQITNALASLPAPAAAPTREEIIEQCAKIARQYIIDTSASQLDYRDVSKIQDGANRASDEIADAILALKAAPAK